MILKRTFILVVLSFTTLYGQNIFIPFNIQQAIKKNTRTYNGNPGDKYFQNYSDYKINATLNPSSGELNGRANITYFNNSSDTLQKIVMRLYQNIFIPGSARDEKVEDINLSKGMVISDLYVDGMQFTKELNVHTRTEGTNYNIFLKKGLKPYDSCQINIAWSFTMPHTSVHRFGKYAESTYFVAMWYPQVAVYDDIDEWDEMQYNGTQEFYNDFNSYDVSISVPGGIMVWATGEWKNPEKILSPLIYERYQLANKSDEVQHIIRQEDIVNKTIFSGRKNSFRYIASHVPDFVFAISDHYLWDAASVVIDSSTGRSVFVSTAYPKESADFPNVTSIGLEIVRRLSYESYDVAYPYPAITIFNGDGGMEYPMMINNRSSRNYNSSVFLTLHEVAHAYFPFMTGINERKYSWMDEGLTSYLTMETQLSMNSDYNSLSNFVAKYDAMSGTETDVPLMVPAYQTRDYSYHFYSYYRSSVAFYMLESLMGREQFRKTIRNFIETWQGKHPTPYDLFGFFKKDSIADTEWIIYQWFFATGYPDLSISGVSSDNENVKISIRKIGNLPVPIVLNFIYENSDTIIVERKIDIWKENKEVDIFQPANSGLKKIELGNLNIPDKNRRDNYYKL
jgi:hypothetical protein